MGKSPTSILLLAFIEWKSMLNTIMSSLQVDFIS